MVIVDESNQLLTVTENGFGKRTPVSEYRKTNRGGSGIINIKTSERNGSVVGLKRVSDKHDIMLITKNGIIIRCDVGRISVIGRNTQGVRLINLDEGDKVVDVAIVEKQAETDEAAPAQAGPDQQITAPPPLSQGNNGQAPDEKADQQPPEIHA
jgi:DNA gyrase subunit A